MKNKYIKWNWFLLVLGVISLLIFSLYLNSIIPYNSIDLKLNKSEALKIAEKFLADKKLDTKDFKIFASVTHNTNAFFYLQKQYGIKGAQEIISRVNNNGLDFVWIFFWYKNVPTSTLYERFIISIAKDGKIVSYQHIVPEKSKYFDNKEAHISKEEANNIAVSFLRNNKIDLTGFINDVSNIKKLENRTNYTFNWTKQRSDDKAVEKITLMIQGNEVGRLTILFGIPESEKNIITQSQSNQSMLLSLSYVYLFLLFLIIQVVFLKKYHEGEIGAKTASYVFFIIWTSLVIETLLKFKILSFGSNIGQLSTDGMGLVILFILIFILWPFFSIMGFSSWSIGESLGRAKFGNKFISIDSFFNKKFFTLNVSNSILNGYSAGFLGLGIITFLMIIFINYFNVFIDITKYNLSLSSSLPFLVPVLYAASSSFFSEMVFRLLPNMYFFKLFNSKVKSLLISSLLWTIYAMSFWGLNISIYPIYFEWVLFFIIGIYHGYIFWKFDILTVISSSFIIIGIMQSIPLITNKVDTFFYQGILSLFILSIPIFVAIIGQFKRKIFVDESIHIPEHIKRITERARMSKELEIARDVQMQLLPKEFPKIDNFEIEGVCVPANEVGGDYYDFIRISDSKLGLVIGDVSGKGVSAAIYMTLTKGVIQSHSETDLPPEIVLSKVNKSLYLMMEKKSFVTLFIGIVDLKEKTLNYCRAGHNPLLLLKHSKKEIIPLKPKGIALGIEKGQIFNRTLQVEKINLNKGDLVVFYTDGFSEAMNRNLDEFTEQRLCESIIKNRDKPVKEIITSALSDVNNFVKGHPQHDDMTIVVMRAG